MGKGKRLKARRKQQIIMGSGLCEELADEITLNFQKELRKTAIWDEMVAEFGEQRAEELLKECKAEVKPGLAFDGSGDRTEDIS
jgi:hypothetical protein